MDTQLDHPNDNVRLEFANTTKKRSLIALTQRYQDQARHIVACTPCRLWIAEHSYSDRELLQFIFQVMEDFISATEKE